MPEPRIIRKHSNRRLWDPLRRGYLVLNDIHDLVVTGTEFNVIDNNRADVTRSELLQVITAQERRADPSMTTEFLLQTIRSHAESPSGMTATFLEQTLRLLHDLSGKQKIRGKAADDSTIARHLAEANYKRWRSVEKMIHRVLNQMSSQESSHHA
jgi:polyhydroxyalkanoate synthesis repressor PhaR